MLISVIAIGLISAGTLFASNVNAETIETKFKKQVHKFKVEVSAIIVTITNKKGEIVYEDIVINPEGTGNIKLKALDKLPKGTYLITIVADDNKTTQKLVVD